jgi:hypothetical protein
MTPSTRSAKKHAKARKRRYLTAQERLARDRRHAQQATEALEQALHALGLPGELVAEIEGRLHSQQQLLGKIVGVMCPPPVWMPHQLRTVPRAGLGQEPAHALAQCAAQTLLAEATPTLGSGGARPTVASRRQQKRGHTQPLAVDLGGR